MEALGERPPPAHVHQVANVLVDTFQLGEGEKSTERKSNVNTGYYMTISVRITRVNVTRLIIFWRIYSSCAFKKKCGKINVCVCSFSGSKSKYQRQVCVQTVK